MLYPLEIVSEFICRIFSLIVRLVVLHSSCMYVDRIIGSLYEVEKLIVDGLIVNVSAVVFDIYREIGNIILIIVEEHFLESEAFVYLVSAVKFSVERVDIGSIVAPAVVVASHSRKCMVCELSLRHIRIIDTLYRKTEHELEF